MYRSREREGEREREKERGRERERGGERERYFDDNIACCIEKPRFLRIREHESVHHVYPILH